MTLGKKIRKTHKAKGLSQETVAAALGVSRQAVTRWESGQSAPSTTNLISLSKLFDLPLGELCDTSDPAKGDSDLSQRHFIFLKFRSNLISAGILLLCYLGLYLVVRLLFVPFSDYSIFGWLLSNAAARQAGYLYGWLCQQGFFLYSILISVIPTLLGKFRFGIITFAGFFAGLIFGELFGSYPSGVDLGMTHYGWVIWGAIFLLSILAGILAEIFSKK